jgi:hypothetical protein
MVYSDMKPVPSFGELSDKDLLHQAHRLAAVEREATASLIECLAEVDARRLYLGEGCSSLFAWCTDVLHLSGDAAYGRIEAARVARRYPVALQALATGSLSMTVLALLRPHLTDANHLDLLAQAHHKSKRQVEQLIATLAPKPDVPSTIRRLPGPEAPVAAIQHNPADLLCEGAATPVEPVIGRVAPTVPAAPQPGAAVPANQRPVVAPLAPERFKIQFTVSHDTRDRLRRAQDLLRHAIPSGDPAAIFDRALIVLITQLEKQKWAAAARPRAASRRTPKGRTIPAAVRRVVSRRDGGRCSFVGSQGRCAATAFLEFHHVVPYARGGEATEENIRLRCRAHNQYEAEQVFGARATVFVREASIGYGRCLGTQP